MAAEDKPVLYPPNPAEHLIDWLYDIGPAAMGAMGEVPLGWTEIDAWCRRTGIDLDPWEGRTIRRLSRAYVAMRHAAEDPACPEPRLDEEEQQEAARERVGDQFAAMARKLKARG